MSRLLLLLATVGIIAYGIWEAVWTDRFSLSREPERAAARLADVSLKLGDWIGQDRELDPRQVKQAEMSGYLLRDYVQASSGAKLTVLLVCGKPGPTCVHTPDVCYQGAGYSLVAQQERHPVKNDAVTKPAEFWMGRFQKTGPAADPLRIYWSWSANGIWSAPDSPRWTFGGSRALYKLYLIRTMTKVDEPLAEDPTSSFVALLLPELQKALFTTRVESRSAIDARRSS